MAKGRLDSIEGSVPDSSRWSSEDLASGSQGHRKVLTQGIIERAVWCMLNRMTVPSRCCRGPLRPLGATPTRRCGLADLYGRT